MQYKVLALDLDGTLTNTEKVITPRTKAALQEAARRGVCIVLASGRPTVGIEPLARELELEKYGGCILSYNGGKIIDCRTGQTLVQHAFPADLIEPVCTFSRYWNVVPLTYDKTGIVTEAPDAPYVLEEARINKIPVRKVENLPAEVTYPINKLLLTGDPADMPHVEELMQQEFAGKLSICRSAPFFIETMPLGVGKDTSLEILLRAKGLTPAKIPTLMNYTTLLNADSMYNTPPCWCIYMTGLVMNYLENEIGGLENMQKRNAAKAKVLYDYLDGQDFYKNPVEKKYRSMMNVTFTSPDADTDKAFCAAATEAGFVNLKGHRLVGGMRASIYNAMPAEGIDKLVDFMEKFRREH